MNTYIFLAIKTIICIYVLVILFFYFAQRRMIYPGSYSGKKYENIHNFSKTELKTENGRRLFAYKITKEGNRKAIFLFHGNSDTAGYILENAINNGYDTLGYDIYAIEYRGFDTAKPDKTTETTIREDVKTLLPLIKKYEKTVYKGHSLGCFAATSLLKEHIPSAIILEAPFFNMAEEANGTYPFIPEILANIILKDKLENDKNVKGLHLKKAIVIHSKNDRTIPFRFGKKLSDTITAAENRFVAIEDSTHGDIIKNDREIITEYLKNL